MIELKGVSKTYDNGTVALKDINLTIQKGEFVFIVGASGAGKSTFLKLIIREEVPNAGEITVNGFKLSSMKKKRAACRKYGAVLICDEIQCGYGRSGKFFAHQWLGIRPDLITGMHNFLFSVQLGETSVYNLIGFLKEAQVYL